MAIDKTKQKVLNKLFEQGFGTEKEISAIGVPELVLLRLTPDENELVLELQNAIKAHKVLSWLSGSEN